LLDYKAIGRRIKYFRLQKNLTQTTLAEKLNVTDKYISSIETGRSKVSLPRLYDIAGIFSIDITCLLKDVNPEVPSFANYDIFEATKDWNPQKKNALLKIIEEINRL